MQTFGAQLGISKWIARFGMVLGRILGLAAGGFMVHGSAGPWAVFGAGALLGVIYGLSRRDGDTNTNLLSANADGVLAERKDGTSLLIPWEDIGAIESWGSVGNYGYSSLHVHVVPGGQETVLTVSQRDVEARRGAAVEVFVPYCSRQAHEGRGREVGARLVALIEPSICRPVLQRIGIDSALAGLVVAVPAHSWTEVVAAMVAFPLVSTIVSLSRYHLRRTSYQWRDPSWQCRYGDVERPLKKVPKSLHLWLEG